MHSDSGICRQSEKKLTLRDNLPDYRTPQDLGLSGYNKRWQIPQFRDVCRENFICDKILMQQSPRR